MYHLIFLLKHSVEVYTSKNEEELIKKLKDKINSIIYKHDVKLSKSSILKYFIKTKNTYKVKSTTSLKNLHEIVDVFETEEYVDFSFNFLLKEINELKTTMSTLELPEHDDSDNSEDSDSDNYSCGSQCSE